MPDASISNEAPRKGRFSWPRLFTGVGILAYLGAWLAPGHYPPWLSFQGESLVFGALIAFGVAWLLTEKHSALDPAVWLPLGLVGLVWVHWGAGLIAYSGDALVSSLYLGGFALAWQLGSALANRPSVGVKVQDSVAGLLLFAAFLSVYIALLQWLDLEAGHANLVVERAARDRPYGNLAQPNHLATLILVGLVMTVWLYSRNYLRLWQTWALVLWFSFGLTMAQSRAAWLSAALLGLLLLGRGLISRGLGGVRSVLVWWLTLIAMWACWGPLNQALLLRHEARSIAEMAQDPTRRVLWQQMLLGLEQSPWWGYGWRQTVAGHKAGTAQLSTGVLTDYAHSLMLDLLLWVGVPLALLLMGVMGWWLLRAVMRLKSLREMVLLAAALPIMVHSLFEYPFAYAYFLFTAAWLLGSLNALQTTAGPASGRVAWPLPRVAVASALLAFAGICAWVGVEYLQVEEDYRVMRFEMRNVGRTPEGHQVPALLLLNQMGAVLKLGRLKPYPGMPDEELESMRRLNRNYNWATLQMRYAVALALNGREDEAVLEMQKLRTHYGERSFQEANRFIAELAQDKYPELNRLQTLQSSAKDAATRR